MHFNSFSRQKQSLFWKEKNHQNKNFFWPKDKLQIPDVKSHCGIEAAFETVWKNIFKYTHVLNNKHI